MATIPSFESILLEVHQSLGLKLESEKDKKKLARLEKPFADHAKIIGELIDEVFTALGMDDHAKTDAAHNLFNLGQFNSAIEQSTWTFDADMRQVVWFLAGYSYAPGLGRLVANWNLDKPFDKGMPGGYFWFLPKIREQDGIRKLAMPVAQVMEWLLDLLGQPMDRIAPNLGGGSDENGRSKSANVDTESIERVLYNWLKEDVPEVENIKRYFNDETKLEFKGALVLDDKLNPEQKFQAAFAFAKRKGLDAESLRNQIPMTQPGRLESIFDGSASNEEKERFTELLAVRYAPPSMRTIRQRLLVARATQDGYRRLGAFLLGKDFDSTCPDPCSNKVLQLLMIFKASYTLTVDAYNHCDNEADEYKYFESRVAPWDKLGIFLSILPSRLETAADELSEKLSRYFSMVQAEDPLEDLIGYDEASTPLVIKRNLARLEHELEELGEIQNAVQRLGAKPHWKRIQEISSYWVASQVAQHSSLSLKTRRLVVTRMRELAQTPSERIGVISIELDQLLNNENRLHRGKDAKARVTKLLEEAKDNSVSNARHANILNFEAKHHLAFNDFETARRLFDEALDACHERGFGRLRGEIARDAFALVVERPPKGYSLGNQDPYYRNMLAYGGFKDEFTGTLTTLEDTACKVSEYFWNDLYCPYFGEENEQPFVKEQGKRLMGDTFELIHKGDWSELQIWFKNNPSLRNKRLREVRGSTALMSWLKMLQEFENRQPSLSAMLSDLPDELKKMTDHFQNWRKAICLMIDAWPKLINIADFKKQTPLMMAANHGDLVIVRKLLQAGADAIQQDFKGRTALHAAIAARSLDCVTELLTYAPDITSIKTFDESSVLHTSVRAGNPEVVSELLQHSPELKLCRDEHQMTALDLAKNLLNPNVMDIHIRYMRSENRRIGSYDDYQEISRILEAE